MLGDVLGAGVYALVGEAGGAVWVLPLGAQLTMMMSSRLACDMADEGLLTRVLPERRSPWLAMVLTVTGTLTALA